MAVQQTIAMKGGGYYARRTQSASRMIDSQEARFLEVLHETEADGDRPFVIADYGAADGGTSLGLLRRGIAAQRARAPRRPVSVVYTDLPEADFAFLFRMLSGGEDGFDSYLDGHDVTASACGISFHRPVLPRESVDLAFSANAMHWLSEPVPIIKGHVHSVGAVGATLEHLRAQGLTDWRRLLTLRGRELRPGGRMMLLTFARTEDGRHLGKNDSDGIFDTLNALWTEMCADGLITENECANTNFAQYYMTLSEVRQPFAEPDASGTGPGHDLVLQECSLHHFPCIYRRQFERDGDAGAFADAFVPNVRSWSERTFLNGVSPTRPAGQRAALVDELYRRYADRVRAHPDRHHMDYIFARVVCRKNAVA